MRYSGTFKMETDGYGFLMNSKGADGNPPPDLPTIDGKPGGVFLSASVARRCLGAKGFSSADMDNKTFTFFVTDSMTHHGKREAYAIRPLNPMTV